MKQNTRFKGDGVSCIDWLIDYKFEMFIYEKSFESGMSDHHHHMICYNTVYYTI